MKIHPLLRFDKTLLNKAAYIKKKSIRDKAREKKGFALSNWTRGNYDVKAATFFARHYFKLANFHTGHDGIGARFTLFIFR